jgi:hypothetical protein
MKYIKTFEISEIGKPKYKEGDYIIFNLALSYCYKGYGLIFNTEFNDSYGPRQYLYEANYIDKKTLEIKELLMYLDNSDIKRKMTADEIADFEIKLNSNKYNL